VAKIKIDPVTRIEGHLRIEAEVKGGKVTEAWAAGTMYRGIEKILEGKDPREAWIWAQRICGVCTTVHAIASVRAVEDAIDASPPPNAELVRNLIAGSQLVHDHVIHFYHLHALDWVDVISALKASPARTSRLAQSISDWPKSSTDYFREVRGRLKRLADSQQLSLFASGYWGHPAYKLTPEQNLLAVAHYLEALEWQRDVIRIHAVLGGKNPHPQTFLVGGMATPVDPNSPQAINPERVEFLRQLIQTMRTFIHQVYIPDILLVASAYPEWTKIGGGTKNFLTYGGYGRDASNERASYLFPRGIVRDLDLSRVVPVEQQKITEQVARSWYRYSDGDKAARHPYDGQTEDNYTGPKPPYQWLNTDSKYSWLKAPRYEGEVMEVGPLARMLVAYAAGRGLVRSRGALASAWSAGVSRAGGRRSGVPSLARAGPHMPREEERGTPAVQPRLRLFEQDRHELRWPHCPLASWFAAEAPVRDRPRRAWCRRPGRVRFGRAWAWRSALEYAAPADSDT
jgi:hydrogenase large subunit